MPRPELLVVSPEAVPAPNSDWIKGPLPGTAAVYRDPALLWRSAREVFARGALTTPQDMRPLIEATFDRSAAGAVPPALAVASDRAEGKEMAEVGIASQNVLDVWAGYNRDAGLWDLETRTPTRLEDRPMVTLRLARLRDGIVVPYADDRDLRRAWALSEVKVAKDRIATCPSPPGLHDEIETARVQWGRWERESERFLLAVMTEANDTLTIAARSEAGTDFVAKYDYTPGPALVAIAVEALTL